jgi:CHAT domain-containing protein/Tfp pilus assembly protein PilF
MLILSKRTQQMNVDDYPLNPTSRLVATGLTFLVLFSAFGSAQSLMEYRRQIAESEQRLEKIRATHDEKAEAVELIRLGELQAHADQASAAVITENKALEICIRLKLVPNAGVAVQDIGWIYMLLENKKKADVYLKKGLELEEAAHNTASQANTLSNLGDLSIQAGVPAEAFDYFARALKIQRDSLNRWGEARTLMRMASAQQFMWRLKESLDTCKKALSIYEDLRIPSQAERIDTDQANAWMQIAAVEFRMGETAKAIKSAKLALELRRSAKDRGGEAVTRRVLGIYALAGGDEKTARSYFDDAVRIHQEIGDSYAEAQDLGTIGGRYGMLGRFETALPYVNRALDILRQDGYDRGLCIVLINIGYAYSTLGQDDKSLQYWAEALQIATRLGRIGLAANITSDMSTAYSETGNFDKAVEFANRALATWRDIGNPYGEAGTLHTLGWIYENAGQPAKALEYFEQALPNHRMVNDLNGLYYTLRGMGEAEEALGNHQKALVDDLAALSAAEEFRSPPDIAQVESTLMRYWRNQKQLDLAAFFGTEAVDKFQQIRQGIQDLDEHDQVEFVKSKSQVYRDLAETLVQLDLLGRAEQVLDMLKEQELQEVVRGESPDSGSKLQPLSLTHAQQKAEGVMPSVEAKADALVELSVTLRTLLEKADRTADDENKLNSLRAEIEEMNRSVSKFFTDTLYPEFARRTTNDDANSLIADEKSGMSALQSTLARFGPNVVGIRVILTNEHGYALLITANGRTRFDLDSAPAALRKEILQVREELRNPGSDPRGHLADLYTSLLGPMKKELEALEQNADSANRAATSPAEGQAVPTILWSLDGSLRYLPIAALFDGRRYMVERFNNVLFTPESYIHMAELNQAPSGSGALAMGLSKGYRNFPALPGVMRELLAVVHDPSLPASHGPLSGSVLPNEQFTYMALKSRLEGETPYPVIHIASHFVMDPGQGSEPYLLLAGDEKEQQDGYRLTLSTLDDSSITFRGTRLLTLSACSTGKPDALQNGMEVESLGMIAQRKDAEAVLASLWDVNDASTSQLMSDFYSRWLHYPSQGKAEALRQAQLALLRTPASKPTGADDRGFGRPPNSSVALPGYSHPYFWAPFVLTGNFL